MKKIGFFLLFGGFLAVIVLCLLVSMFTHGWWIWHSKQIHSIGMNPDDLSWSIREISLKLNAYMRATVYPALAMLIGGLLLARSTRRPVLPAVDSLLPNEGEPG